MGQEDLIQVYVDTLQLNTVLYAADSIISAPDSFLLGEMQTPYGTLKAEILTQLACPIGFQYPETATADSLVLYLTYSSWIGDSLSPMEIRAWYLDRGSLEYESSYGSNIDISQYASTSDSTYLLDNPCFVTPSRMQMSNGQYIISLPLRKEFCDRFFSYRKFISQEDFDRFVSGLYISTDFGASTILNVRSVELGMFYTFTYSKAGRDTLVHDVKGFYANSEVRQLNRIAYLENQTSVPLIDRFSHYSDSNFVIAPAGIYTQVNVPIGALVDTIYSHVDPLYHRAYVNLAQMNIEVLNVYRGASADIQSKDWAQPARYMMLVKKDVYENGFFRDNAIEMDTAAIVSTLGSATDSVGAVHYYYSYDMSAILTRELRKDLSETSDTIKMLLVPVDVATSTSSGGSTSATSISESQEVSTTIIRSASISGASHSDPLEMQVVYSRF